MKKRPGFEGYEWPVGVLVEGEELGAGVDQENFIYSVIQGNS